VGHFLQKQWFLIGIAAASVLAYFFPEWGDTLRRYGFFSIGIFLAFFITGLSLETRSIFRQVQEFRAPVAAACSSLILYPLLAWLMALPVLPYEFVIGVCIIAVGPVTVSSGTIMTAIARGNVPLSLCICILTSFLAIFTIPLMLNMMLSVGGKIELPVLKMLGGLILKVLVPIVLGQIVRPFIKNIIQRINNPLSIFQSCIIILIIFRAVSSSAENLNQAGTTILSIFAFMAFLHFFMLLLNYGIATLLKLERSSITAFTIHTSQKTLTVTYIVWAGYFAHDYPMAFIPAIICQLIQMTVGTFAADFFKKRALLPLK
jgi:sodium/bile acid cotransporter 7